MLLNASDVQSQTWIKIKKLFEDRLAEHRVRNDGRLTEEETAYLRGRIAEAKHILSLADKDPVTLNL